MKEYINHCITIKSAFPSLPVNRVIERAEVHMGVTPDVEASYQYDRQIDPVIARRAVHTWTKSRPSNSSQSGMPLDKINLKVNKYLTEQYIHEHDRFVLFGLKSEIGSLNGNHWVADGTFEICSNLDGFVQTYIVSIKYEVNENVVLGLSL